MGLNNGMDSPLGGQIFKDNEVTLHGGFINSEYVVRDERERKEKVVKEMNPVNIKPLNLKKKKLLFKITLLLT